MHEAEQLAVGEQFYILPLYAMKSVNLVNPKIEGIRQIPASGALEYRYAKSGPVIRRNNRSARCKIFSAH